MDDDIQARLRAPFAASEIHWRVGATTKDKSKGMALAFIDARRVMDRLDYVLGIGGWSDSYERVGATTLCTIRVLVPTQEDWQWVSKTDGAGDTDVESEKGAISDAFKRAAVKLGIGRYLYDLPSPWVAIQGAGNSFKITPGAYAELNAIAAGGVVEEEPKAKPAAKKKAAAKKAAPPVDEDEPPAALTVGQQLLQQMRERCAELGVNNDAAGAAISTIIVADLGLPKTPDSLTANFEAISTAISTWTPM